ncbi:MAG: hypothetical protein EOP54_06115 [Sphingobacteriales bacterium]|nr:MAG: hypothetical protein EOP54_06115 [Sphingobacteriales bacterium]
MIKRTLLFAAIATLLWSCGSENSEKTPEAAVATTQNAVIANTDTPNNALTEAVQAKDGAITPQNEIAAPANKPAGAVKLNPAHGQPGHSCSVPVGAPLTAAATTPAAAAPQPAQMAPVSPAAAPQGQQLLPNGKVNPPHGQPGHVCM